MTNDNPWKYVQVDPDTVKDNPYLNPKKEEEVEPTVTQGPSPSSVKVFSKDDFLVLEDIVCVGADGKVFEEYDKLRIKK
ncbi:MAG: hypothetical protein U9Q69_04475, partial [Nanoarchaeota archaeon]|nr:hypothetical protein [Nanoarchaeota archaeon]